MPLNLKKSKYRKSPSKSYESSVKSSSPSNSGLTPKAEVDRTMTRSDATPEIRAAQKLLAQIAVRILTSKKGQSPYDNQ